MISFIDAKLLKSLICKEESSKEWVKNLCSSRKFYSSCYEGAVNISCHHNLSGSEVSKTMSWSKMLSLSYEFFDSQRL